MLADRRAWTASGDWSPACQPAAQPVPASAARDRRRRPRPAQAEVAAKHRACRAHRVTAGQLTGSCKSLARDAIGAAATDIS